MIPMRCLPTFIVRAHQVAVVLAVGAEAEVSNVAAAITVVASLQVNGNS